MINERNRMIDIARGIGIILVIVGHLHHFFEWTSMTYIVIYSFHIPLFLIVSGICQKNRKDMKIMDIARDKFISIMVPYFVFSILTLLFVFPESAQAKQWMVGMFIGIGDTDTLGFNIPLWFLPMLFCATMIFSVINKIANIIARKSIIRFTMFLGVCSLLCVFLGKRMPQLPYSLNNAMVAQFFLFVGFGLRTIYMRNQNLFKSKMVQVILFVSCLLIWLAGLKINGRVDMNSETYNYVPVYLMTGIVGSILTLFVSSAIDKIFSKGAELLAYIGRSSMYIMVFHIPVVNILYDNRILKWLPAILRENVWEKNIFGLGYVIVGDIVISLFMKFLLESSRQKVIKQR